MLFPRAKRQEKVRWWIDLLASFINRLALSPYVWRYEQAYEVLSLPYREMQKYNLSILAYKELCVKSCRDA